MPYVSTCDSRRYMHRFHSKCCVFVLVISLLDFGCTHRVVKKVDPAITNADREEIVGVTTNRAEDVRFDSPGGALRNGVISARVRGPTTRLISQTSIVCGSPALKNRLPGLSDWLPE